MFNKPGRPASAAALVAAIAGLAAGAVLVAQSLEATRAAYTKYEVYVPMRDGVRLFTSVYVPKDQPEPSPILLNRTPYSVAPYGPDRFKENVGPSTAFSKRGYIVVYQDVRGRFMSEGTFEHVRPHKPTKSGPGDIDESTDTWDTIDWLVKHVPRNNGRVGTWGISYPGFYVAAGMVDAHPALKAASPQAPVSDWFAGDDWHHNGAFLLAHAVGFFSAAGWPFVRPSTEMPRGRPEPETEDGYESFMRLGPNRNANERIFRNEIPFWNELMRHDTRTDFWKARNIRQHLRNIKPAVMTVGGWFDAENLDGALEVYRAVERQSPAARNTLVMGPWVHGGWARQAGDRLGDVRFDAATSEFFRDQIEVPFFDSLLKSDGANTLPEAYMFETGTNQWRRFDVWPPPSVERRTLYFHADGALSFDPPPAGEDGAHDEYVSDPRRPVPYLPGIARGMAQRYMVDDQRFASRRTDVLTYQTAVLEEDVTVAGPLLPRLHVSTSGTDADWVVKLIDVYPDRFPDERGSTDNPLGGYQQLVRGDIIRGKFRNSLEKPEPFTPGRPTAVNFAIPDALHTFRRGHRIMVQVQSSWFPLFDRNPHKFMNINEATDADFQKATHRVYRSADRPSCLQIGVLPR